MSSFDFDAALRGIFSPNPILVPVVCPETTPIDATEETVVGDLHQHHELMRLRLLIHQLEGHIGDLTEAHVQLHKAGGETKCGEFMQEIDNLSAHVGPLRSIFHLQLQRAYRNPKGKVARLRADWKVVAFVDTEECGAGCVAVAHPRFGNGCS